MRRGVAALALLAAAGCQERLTAPADCPALCPGGQAAVLDTILTAVPGRDSSYTGYVAAGAGSALLVSSGLAASEDRAVVRFAPRGDSIAVADTLRAYAVDSVALSFALVARDTTVPGVRLHLYRLPPAVDTATPFAAVEAELAPENLIGTIAVPDSLRSGGLTLLLRGEELARVALAPEDQGVLAVGMRVEAPAPTGVRIRTTAGGGGASFLTYATVDIPDPTANRAQTIARGPAFETFVSQGTPPADPALLRVGGEPSSRALVRFDIPPRIRDSATILRATLELVPTQPVFGLPTDPAVLQARPVLADLGAKSVLSPDSLRWATVALPAGTAEPVGLEVVPLVLLWQGPSGRPPAIFLNLLPEAASFSRPVFGSTRAGSPPRLRVSYSLRFPFESP